MEIEEENEGSSYEHHRERERERERRRSILLLSSEEQRERSSGAAQATNNDSKFSTLVIMKLAFQSLGVVYGDLGTSPLYVFHSTFPKGIKDKEHILEILSVIIYTLGLIPLIKYTLFVIKANDSGEGGTFALYSIICRHVNINTIMNWHHTRENISNYNIRNIDPNSLAEKIKNWLERKESRQVFLLILVLFGTSMVIGDGILTPAISVLSSVSGIQVRKPHVHNGWVLALALAILVGLFGMQHLGTEKLAWVFSPTILTWFLCIGIIGIYNIVKYDTSVFRALSPLYIFRYFAKDPKNSWISLGGIMLSITGTEALYADVIHFPARSVQLAFVLFVFPCLLLAYMGQAAFLLKFPEHVDETFYRSIPDPVYWPMFLVATAAAVAASQASISATFSIIKQAEALGCFPRVKVVHTSKKLSGKVYIPEINWLLMVLCLIITFGFRKTSQIGNAYGIAVVAVMLVTTILMGLVMLFAWQSNIVLIAVFVLVFLSVELFYFSSMLFKFQQGGWAPLAIGAVFLFVMCTWHYGTLKRFEFEAQNRVSLTWILNLLGPMSQNMEITRVPGVAFVYTDLTHGVPSIFSHFITHIPAIHQVVVFVCVQYLPVSRIPQEERFVIVQIGVKDFLLFRCLVQYGYAELHKRDDGFEDSLLDHLAKFIQEDDDSNEDTVQSPDSHISLGGEMIFSHTSSPGNQTTVPEMASSSRQRMVRFAPRPVHIGHDRLRILSEARESGIVHILGDPIIRARTGSNLAKKFTLDYVYAFLQKVCRESSVTLNMPHETLFITGQIYHL